MKSIAIACQGGGSHTAFTAGALQTLLRHLDRSRYRVMGLSGTSGGAMCATIAWYGLLIGNPEDGARRLEQFWEDIAASSPWDRAVNDVLVWISRWHESLILPELSPYQAPPDGQRRLEETIEKYVPFAQLDSLVASSPLALHVGAVNALSGEFTVFRAHHSDPGLRITAKALLASAAVPRFFRGVHIGKGIYWDGLFSENPPIRSFLSRADSRDTKPDEIWIIQINPETWRREPRTMRDIEDRRNELSGNLSLNQEVAMVEQTNAWLERGWLSAEHFKPVTLRWIPLTLELDYASKLDRDPAMIRRLIEHGRKEAAAFIAALP